MSRGRKEGAAGDRRIGKGTDGGSSPPASIDERMKPCQQEVLAGLLFEWGLRCWCVVGYDGTGSLVRMYQASTDMEAKALEEAYREWGEALEVEFEEDEDGDEWKEMA
jgi:hypothetical protein